MNLLAVLKENITDTVVSRAAYYVDENEQKTRSALEGLIHTVVAGLMKRTTTEIGVNQLFNAIQKGKFDGNLIATFPDLLRDSEQTGRLVEAGNNSISHLLPAMKSSIGLAISGYANIKNSAAITLLGMVTPLVLGTLNQLVVEKKLDADGLSALLADQRDALVETTPDRLLDRIAEGLNIQQMLEVGVTPARRSAAIERPQRTIQERPRFAPEPEEESNGSLVKWGVGVLILLALAAGGYYIWNNTQSYSSAEEQANSTEFSDSATSGDSTGTTAAAPAKRDTTAVKPAATASLAAYLADPQQPAGRSFRISALDFEPGSLQLKPSGITATNELTALLKTHPTMQIRLVGYASDAKPPMSNRVLSLKRVSVIKQQMIQGGINFVRVDAIGLGSGVKPSDSTAAAKPRLKQIDVKVITK